MLSPVFANGNNLESNIHSNTNTNTNISAPFIKGQCLQNDSVEAHYQITTAQANLSQVNNAKRSLSPTKTKISQQLNFLRKKNSVIYQNESTHITEQWHLQHNKAISLTRYFDIEKQGIEYQANEMKNTHSWQQFRLMISPDLLKSMTLIKQEGEGCNKIQHYTQTSPDKKHTITLTWLPELELIDFLEVKTIAISVNSVTGMQSNNFQQITTWQLDDFSTSSKKVTTAFNAWQAYQSTDYADIGDNESDPFIAKMIHQGFVEHGASGFYHADGSPIKQHHNH